jgi:hypothetical protein
VEVVDTAVPADGCDACVCMPLMATAMIACSFFPSHLPRDEMPNSVPFSHGLPTCLCDESAGKLTQRGLLTHLPVFV